jgi:hypothetical protein
MSVLIAQEDLFLVTGQPQGSSLGSKLCCLGPSSLVDPIRPTGKHVGISPSGLYPAPSLCTCVPRQLATGSELSLSILSRRAIFHDPGEFVDCLYSVPSSTTLAFIHRREIQHSHGSPSASSERCLRGSISSLTLRPVELLASLGGSDWRCHQPTEAFTFGLPMSRSPSSLPNITTVATEQFPLTGLSPVRIAASFAAPSTSTTTFTSTCAPTSTATRLTSALHRLA